MLEPTPADASRREPFTAWLHSTHAEQVRRYMQNAMGYGIAPGTKLTVVWDGRFKEYAA